MGNIVLFVFEGIKPEKQIYDIVNKYFLQDIRENSRIVYYEADIYNFGDILLSDPDLDFFELLKEHSPNPELDNVCSEEIAEIFLFFDYDPHATKASDITVDKLIEIFDNETEKGKLYISYPMSESIRDCDLGKSLNCTTCKLQKDDCGEYKTILDKKNAIKDLRKITFQIFKELIHCNITKANCLIHCKCEKPTYESFSKFGQKILHEHQIQLSGKDGTIMILSAYPFFILEYFNESYYNKI